MKSRAFLCLCSVLVFGVVIAHGGPCTSKDVSASVFINNAWPNSVLLDDGLGAYTNNVDGVLNAVIHHCTGDATLALSDSARSITFLFPAPIPDSIIAAPAPPWAGGSLSAKPFLNVNEILWGRNNNHACPIGSDPTTCAISFTTRMQFSNIRNPGDSQRNAYMLRFQPINADAPVGYGAPSDVNTPYETSVVTVQDFPGTCQTGDPNGTLDYWIVTANNPSPDGSGYMQVGTLYRNQGTGIHAGQYQLPFQLIIRALACVPPK